MAWTSPHGRALPDWSNGPLLMGILNITPDSFSDGGKFCAPDSALKRAEAMIAQGADIIDIGAESTRPASKKISAEEELQRLLPVLKNLRKAFSEIAISVDTYKPDVARAAIEAGADIVNDVCGAMWRNESGEAKMAQTCAELKCPVVLMHNSFDNGISGDAVEEIKKSLLQSVQICADAGVTENQIILDVGFGFGKTPAQNLEILKRIAEFRVLGKPLLLGLSRKSTLGAITGRPENMRDEETLAANAWAVSQSGADIIRVHDVAKNKIALDVLKAIRCGIKWTK